MMDKEQFETFDEYLKRRKEEKRENRNLIRFYGLLFLMLAVVLLLLYF